ncbi:MAG: hypothetical protein Q7T41_01155 [Candidatus Saccharibacteria bacterium]|nr:hypothetical protein [Candidatus Saccharibacteria bacterium]
MNLVELMGPVEAYNENGKFCGKCPKKAGCAILGAIYKLDDWCSDNAIPEKNGVMHVANSSPEQVEALILRPHVGELIKDLIGLQGDCVASMQTGQGSLQETVVEVRARSVVGDLAA